MCTHMRTHPPTCLLTELQVKIWIWLWNQARTHAHTHAHTHTHVHVSVWWCRSLIIARILTIYRDLMTATDSHWCWEINLQTADKCCCWKINLPSADKYCWWKINLPTADKYCCWKINLPTADKCRKSYKKEYWLIKFVQLTPSDICVNTFIARPLLAIQGTVTVQP